MTCIYVKFEVCEGDVLKKNVDYLNKKGSSGYLFYYITATTLISLRYLLELQKKV